MQRRARLLDGLRRWFNIRQGARTALRGRRGAGYSKQSQHHASGVSHVAVRQSLSPRSLVVFARFRARGSGNFSLLCIYIFCTNNMNFVHSSLFIYLFIYLKVLFVDEKSRSFVKENNNCDFYISSDESSSGVLENPKHSLPPNTTCRYHFQGKPNEIVWLSFVKYYAASADAAASIDVASDCNAKLFIWDGDRTLDKLIPIRKVRYTLE